MKTETTTLAETNFRQLTSYEIDYPMYGIGKFWALDAYIEFDYRSLTVWYRILDQILE